jgi:hypothetical protein
MPVVKKPRRPKLSNPVEYKIKDSSSDGSFFCLVFPPSGVGERRRRGQRPKGAVWPESRAGKSLGAQGANAQKPPLKSAPSKKQKHSSPAAFIMNFSFAPSASPAAFIMNYQLAPRSNARGFHYEFLISPERIACSFYYEFLISPEKQCPQLSLRIPHSPRAHRPQLLL